jgi:hypothetical protein
MMTRQSGADIEEVQPIWQKQIGCYTLVEYPCSLRHHYCAIVTEIEGNEAQFGFMGWGMDRDAIESNRCSIVSDTLGAIDAFWLDYSFAEGVQECELETGLTISPQIETANN